MKYVKSLKVREKNSLKAGEKYPLYIDWVESETHKGLVSCRVKYHNSRKLCELFSRSHAILENQESQQFYVIYVYSVMWIHSTSFIVGAKLKRSEAASLSDNVNSFKYIPFMLSRSKLLKCLLIQVYL